MLQGAFIRAPSCVGTCGYFIYIQLRDFDARLFELLPALAFVSSFQEIEGKQVHKVHAFVTPSRVQSLSMRPEEICGGPLSIIGVLSNGSRSRTKIGQHVFHVFIMAFHRVYPVRFNIRTRYFRVSATRLKHARHSKIKMQRCNCADRHLALLLSRCVSKMTV